MSAWRILKKYGFNKTKPTRKPGLTDEMKAARLHFCKLYEHWTLADWKKVIWSDETSILLHHGRGSWRIWRRTNERTLRSCIRERWKGFSEFMFWGCFTYDFKGPCHIYPTPKAEETRKSQELLAKWNQAIEPEMRAKWQAEVDAKQALARRRSILFHHLLK